MKSAVPCTGRAYLNAGGPFQPNCGIIYPVSACEPQAKHEFSGIDTMFLSEHERHPKCELRKWYIVRETTGSRRLGRKGKWQIAAATVKESS